MKRRFRFRSLFALAATFTFGVLMLVPLAVIQATPAGADSAPQMSIDDVSQLEGNTGTVNYVFTVRLGYKANNEVDVNYASADNTAVAPADYTPVHGTLVFAPGIISKTITVVANGNTVHDGNRAFNVNLTSPVNAALTDAQGTGTIIDDDPLPYVSVGNVFVNKPSTGTTNATFGLTLSSASAQTVSVHYFTSNGTGVAGVDYVQTQGWATFAPGATTQTVNVAVKGNGADNGNHNFYLNANTPVNAAVSASQGIATIVNSNPLPSLTINNVQQVEGNSGTSNFVFTVTLQPATTATVTAVYATGDSSATLANNDYQYTQGTLTFNPGDTTKTISVPVVGDTTAESNETFAVNLGSVTNATALSSTGYGIIVNDDPSVTTLPSLQIGDQTVIEGDTGTSSLVFPVTLSSASTSTVTVTYTSSDGSAAAPGDYTATSGPLTFTAGQTSKTITVPIVGDKLAEPDEVFYMTLSSPANATVLDSQATGRIINNDVSPGISVTAPAINEGNSGTTNMGFTVSLSAASTNTVTVHYATSDGTAAAGSDYVATSSSLTFTPGQTSMVVNVPVTGDTIKETDEYFYLTLSSPTNATIPYPNITGYIVNDDFNSTLTVNDASVYEGQSGSTNASFTVKLSPASANTVQVNYTTADGNALAGTDYTAKTGTLIFTPGQTSQTITVSVLGNTRVQANRYFVVNLSAAANADIVDTQGYGTIIDDDVNPVMNIGDVTMTEGNSGTKAFVFPVTLTSASSNTVTANYATADETASSASDYVAASGALTFTPGQTAKTVSVSVKGDTTIEPDEYFAVNLSSVVNAVSVDAQAVGIIQNDDLTPKLSITSHAITEGNSGTTNNTLTVTLQPASPNTVTVNYATSDGTAAAGSDYAATSGTLTFNPGDTSKPINVPVTGDTTAENNEYFAVSLSAAVGASVSTGTGYGYIINDDAGGQAATSYVTVSDSTVTEGNTGTVNETFTLGLSPAATKTVTVNYNTTDGTATAAGGDYNATSGTVVFTAGQTSKPVTVAVNGNTAPGSDRYLGLSLGTVNGALTANSSAYGYILEDDPGVRASINDTATVEPDTGSLNATFTVALNAASAQTIFIDYATSNGSAVSPSDYTPTFGTLTFAPGQTSQTVNVPVKGDNAVEGTEYYYLDLSSPVNVVLNDNSGQGEIFDTDIFTDSGKVTSGNGAALSGVTMTIAGNNQPSTTAVTDVSGNYTLAGVPNGTYTVTPTKTNYKFWPAVTTIVVRGATITGTTFLGETGTYIEGIVTTSTGGALSATTITRSGGGQPTVTVTTNSGGYYAIPASPAGSYTVTATRAGYTFSPTSYPVTVAATGIVNQDFVGVLPAFIIGRVATSAGVGVAGVTMTRTGGGQATTTVKTNSQGYYGFSAQPTTAAGVTYTITPTLTGKTFTPVSTTATVSTTVNATKNFVSS